MQVWLSSLNGWVCGVDGPERVDEDLAAAAKLLLDYANHANLRHSVRTWTSSTQVRVRAGYAMSARARSTSFSNTITVCPVELPSYGSQPLASP